MSQIFFNTLCIFLCIPFWD